MPAIKRSTQLAAGGSTPNLYAGSAFEYVRANALLSAGLGANAVGSFATFNVGSDVVLEEFPIDLVQDAAGNDIFPLIPDHFDMQVAAAAGDRVVLAIRNPTAGAINYRSTCLITYI